MNRPVSLALWAGTFAGVALCLGAAVAHAAAWPIAPRLARLGVLAILLTPPLRLAVTAGAFWRAGRRRYAAAAAIVLLALVVAAIRAAAP
ncbi:MAG TPA: DUF1634 domain-containing protein [Anaeromyxobacter sp.]|nr:DUF1634 domain-containing protein [Anaeromyxobacter sp.]